MAEEDLLIPNDIYLKSGMHIGTKFKTKDMDKFIYKTRVDGLSVMNIKLIDERIRVAAKLLSNYEPKDIIVLSRRENGWRGISMFERLTGARALSGRYPPGILTNAGLENYTEAKILIITDAWPDRNAVLDALKIGIPVIALSDTNNQANGVDLIVPCNNKGKKSLSLMFYLIAREYLKIRGTIKSDSEMSIKIEDFFDEE